MAPLPKQERSGYWDSAQAQISPSEPSHFNSRSQKPVTYNQQQRYQNPRRPAQLMAEDHFDEYDEND